MSAANHTYTVELRVYARDLVPEQVTQRTGLQPARARAAGSRTGSKVHPNAMWSFDGGSSGERLEWATLEDGLRFVLDALAPGREDVRSCVGDASVVWWCGHFQSSFDGGPTLSAELLTRLAAFGVPLYIDNYFSRSGQTPETPEW